MTKSQIQARLNEIEIDLSNLRKASSDIGRLTVEDHEDWSDRAQMKLEISYEVEGLKEEKAALTLDLVNAPEEAQTMREGNNVGGDGLWDDEVSEKDKADALYAKHYAENPNHPFYKQNDEPVLEAVGPRAAAEGFHYGRNRDGVEGYFEDYEESIGEI